METGRYTYPFQLVLPRNIPSTFTSCHGYIEYYLKANVDIPMAFDYKDKKGFIVVSPIDLNDMLDRLVLVSIEDFFIPRRMIIFESP